MPAAEPARIFPSAADRRRRRVRDRHQLEALMRACATARPGPPDTIHLLHHRLPP